MDDDDSETILQIEFFLDRNRKVRLPWVDTTPPWFWKLYDFVNQGYNVKDLEPSWLE